MPGENEAVAIVILAAGLGTRMKSNKAKVLHHLLGRPMISYVVDTAIAVAGDNVVLVVGHQADEVRAIFAQQEQVKFAFQDEQLGTGHAVKCALPALPESADHVVVLCGDVPLLRGETLQRFVHDHCSQERTLSVLAMQLENPTGYGRIVQDKGGYVVGIVEEADATPDQKTIRLVNTGIYCIDRRFLVSALQELKSDNAQGEYYLTDIVGMAHHSQLTVGVTIGEKPDEFTGINSRDQLKAVEDMMRSARA